MGTTVKTVKEAYVKHEMHDIKLHTPDGGNSLYVCGRKGCTWMGTLPSALTHVTINQMLVVADR